MPQIKAKCDFFAHNQATFKLCRLECICGWGNSYAHSRSRSGL